MDIRLLGKPASSNLVSKPAPTAAAAINRGSFTDPFNTAMSGTQSGTLQDYINRMTQQGSNSLYGGLLGYSPQSLMSGNAGGQGMQSQVPQGFNIPSALQSYMQQNGGLNFGNRSWMNQGG